MPRPPPDAADADAAKWAAHGDDYDGDVGGTPALSSAATGGADTWPSRGSRDSGGGSRSRNHSGAATVTTRGSRSQRRRSSLTQAPPSAPAVSATAASSSSTAAGTSGGVTVKPGDPLPARFGPYRSVEVLRVRQAFERADVDGSGDVDLQELLASPDWAAMYSPDRIADMFAAMDADGSGSITAAELLRLAFPLVDGRTLAEMVVLTTPRTPGAGRLTAAALAARRRGSGGSDAGSVGGGGGRSASGQQHAPPPPQQQQSALDAGAFGPPPGPAPLPPGVAAEFDAMFDALDENGDGAVTMEELLHVMDVHAAAAGTASGGGEGGSGGWGLAALAETLRSYDTDANQVMERAEFTALMADVWRAVPPDAAILLPSLTLLE